ncbi:MAG TPA: class I lanthipeptide [Kofleriaceae bacterium]|nr:class I lanthipeptide [Kofleriaceae bacterium]
MKQIENKSKKLVINKESIRALSIETMKRDEVTAPGLSPCTRCGTTR